MTRRAQAYLRNRYTRILSAVTGAVVVSLSRTRHHRLGCSSRPQPRCGRIQERGRFPKIGVSHCSCCAYRCFDTLSRSGLGSLATFGGAEPAPSSEHGTQRCTKQQQRTERAMSLRNRSAASAPGHPWRIRAATALVIAAALATTAYGVTNVTRAQASPRVTVAAIDPSLVAGRGAQLGIVEQEAENATTNGTILPFDPSAYTLSGEASGRQAVKLTPGQYVAFKLTQRANAITIRYAIPDAPNGGGIDAPLTVGVDHNGRENTHPQTITLTSKYSWLYNQYPFTNDPNADLLHPDWWITECSCVPAFTTPPPTITKPFRPMHFYDEHRVQLHNTYQAGDVVRLTMPADANAAWTVIDLVDLQQIADPAPRPDG